MGTSSTIALLKKDGTVDSVFCHWDGYLHHNGLYLYKYYSEINKIKDMLDLGGIISLREKVVPPLGQMHTFDNPLPDVTTFAKRDKGQYDSKKSEYDNLEQYSLIGSFHEYNYLFNEVKNEWFVFNEDRGKLLKLTSLLLKDPLIDNSTKEQIRKQREKIKLAKKLDKTFKESNACGVKIKI